MLDRIDAAILTVLQNDARCSNKELAARVGLAPSSCLERVRRLRERGVLRGFRAEVDPAAIGIRLEAMIAIRLDRHGRDVVRRFEEEVLALPEVAELYHVAGETDYLVRVAVRDSDHLRRIAVDALGARDDVRDIQTAVIFGHRRAAALPNFARPE